MLYINFSKEIYTLHIFTYVPINIPYTNSKYRVYENNTIIQSVVQQCASDKNRAQALLLELFSQHSTIS